MQKRQATVAKVEESCELCTPNQKCEHCKYDVFTLEKSFQKQITPLTLTFCPFTVSSRTISSFKCSPWKTLV